MLKVYPLYAAHGDALIVEAETDEGIFRIVVDGGPDETAVAISERYLSLKHIDLLVLTHYDTDHITGLIHFFKRLKGDKCIVDKVWANCASIVDYDDEENVAAYEEAYVLSKHLEKLKKRGLIGEWNDYVIAGMPPVSIGPFRIDVLTPTKDILMELLKHYREYIEKEGLQDDPDIDEQVSFGRVQRDAAIDLSELATKFRPTTTSFMNKTSIALRIQAKGKTILLLGDAEAKMITDSIAALGVSKEKPMNVDLIKVSHHGSKANINKHLFELTNCSKYLFTTNGGSSGAYHPDRQTIACIDAWVRKNEEPITLYFNYPLSTIMDRNVGLLSDKEKNKFTIVEGNAAITL